MLDADGPPKWERITYKQFNQVQEKLTKSNTHHDEMLSKLEAEGDFLNLKNNIFKKIYS